MPTPFRRRERDPGSAEPPAQSVRPVRYRSVMLSQLAVYAALAAGPVALLVSCAADSAPVRSAPKAAAQSTVRSAPDPGGYAALFVDCWLRSAGQEGDRSRALESMAPGVRMPEWGDEAPRVERVGAVRSQPVGAGGWSVTVAVQTSSPEPRYFSVPVRSQQAGGGARFTVSAAPAEVSAPKAAKQAPDPYSKSVNASSPLAGTVEDFLSSYVGGSGGAERYLAPGVSLPAVAPSPYEEVRVESVTAASGDGEGRVGKDGERVRVRAMVTARDADGGTWPLAYALRLVARDGRWEVGALESGLEHSSGKGAQAAAQSSGVVRKAAAVTSPGAMRTGW
ncbi:conjugal transfer protein (plasmid) [Streptomyces sp. NBC_01186]|uniref:conjugal transfer protein n=1 Tax=unclassified Streptomyces TaxID=2593676 RepID=UPI002DDAFC2A|nr:MULTISPECIES: conjugal transfer protein [unclassified Streptomyces]WSB81992.1 conjugal transfer protein [Streptomyces sp. NBC_01775]WSS17967.1 conjugal transfer protein [Streptomyces sp. NBC_01186]